MHVGLLTFDIHLPGCASLKEKRSRIKPLLARLHREFNVSTAEIAKNDAWQEAILACALVSNDATHTRRALQQVARWVETNWHDVSVISEKVELW